MVPVIDMHCDTISLIEGCRVRMRKSGTDAGEGYAFSYSEDELKKGIDLRKNGRMIDLLRMKESGYLCQCFALYISKRACLEAEMTPFEYLCEMSDLFDELMAENSNLIRPALSAAELEKNFSEGYMSALKTVEEGLPYEGKLENLREAYRRGVRKSTLTWNYENELAFPNPEGARDVDTQNGLKKAGFEFIEAMEEMGMVIDISHLNDAGIRDIFSVVRPDTPIVASHSNARAVCPHHRNLSDEMLRKLSDHGGITGINFCAAFLHEDFIDSNGGKLSRISDMIRHMKYIRNVAGIDSIGLGSDFDGISGPLEVNGCGEIQKIAEAMDLAGFTDEEIEKVFWKNAMRVYKTVLK